MIPPHMDGARCVGKEDQFASTRAEDHEYAKAHCAACPVFEACEAWKKVALADWRSRREVKGTWAGELHIQKKRGGRRVA